MNTTPPASYKTFESIHQPAARTQRHARLLATDNTSHSTASRLGFRGSGRQHRPQPCNHKVATPVAFGGPGTKRCGDSGEGGGPSEAPLTAGASCATPHPAPPAPPHPAAPQPVRGRVCHSTRHPAPHPSPSPRCSATPAGRRVYGVRCRIQGRVVCVMWDSCSDYHGEQGALLSLPIPAVPTRRTDRQAGGARTLAENTVNPCRPDTNSMPAFVTCPAPHASLPTDGSMHSTRPTHPAPGTRGPGS